MMARSRLPDKSSSSPSRRCSVTSVPRPALFTGSIVYSPLPGASHPPPFSAPRPVVGAVGGAPLPVETDVELQLGVVFKQVLRGQRLEAQLVAGVGSVRNQLAQEDLLLACQQGG